MGKIKERVAYLQGLIQGLDVNYRSVEGKLLVNIIDVLADMAEEINSIQMVQTDLEMYVESMDEDLTELEEAVYEDVDGEDFVQIVTRQGLVQKRRILATILPIERCSGTCLKVSDLSQKE